MEEYNNFHNLSQSEKLLQYGQVKVKGNGDNILPLAETKIPKANKKKQNIVMLPGMGAAAAPPQQGQKIVNPNGGVGNSIDYPFLSSSKSDGFGALESKMIYNVVE